MKSSKIFVVDLDETLTRGGESRVERRVGDAVRSLRREGWVTILATGRDRKYLSARRDLDGLFDAWIAEAGLTIQIISTGFSQTFITPGWLRFIDELKRMGVGSPKEHTISIRREHISEVKRQALKQGIEVELKDNKGNIILLPRGVSKASALRKLLKTMDIQGFTAAVGDSEVDLELLREADFAAAVANADEKVKKIADYVASRENGEGVIEVIMKLLKI